MMQKCLFFQGCAAPTACHSTPQHSLWCVLGRALRGAQHTTTTGKCQGKQRQKTTKAQPRHDGARQGPRLRRAQIIVGIPASSPSAMPQGRDATCHRDVILAIRTAPAKRCILPARQSRAANPALAHPRHPTTTTIWTEPAPSVTRRRRRGSTRRLRSREPGARVWPVRDRVIDRQHRAASPGRLSSASVVVGVRQPDSMSASPMLTPRCTAIANYCLAGHRATGLAF